LGGLEALLRTSESELVFVLAVDLPRISSTLIQKIASLAKQPGGTGLVPRAGDEIESLVAVYPKAMLLLAQERLQGSTDHSMQSLVKEAAKLGFLNWYEIQEHERQEFSNWNLPEPA
jgi:molybdopterin-guanine dinucleotide biosynthesis protein A